MFYCTLAALAALVMTGCARSDPALDTETLAATAPPGQLPQTARPLAYDLAMRIDPKEEFFSGNVSIQVELLQEGRGLWLHGDDLDVTEITVTPASGAAFEATYTEILPSGVVWVGFPSALKAGEITLDITYSGAFDASLAGLFRVEEQGDVYALAKSESIQARRYLPGFDEPAYKAPFNISLTIPAGDVAISNTPEISRQAADPSYETVRFATTRPLPTYLLSLAVGPFDVVTAPDLPPNSVRSKPIPLRGIARHGRGADLAYALSITPELVEIFETELGVPYPYAKLDIVAAPQWPSGATELAGAITYRESRILLPEGSSAAARRSLLGIHSHEIAHMWFGNLVTPPWWDDLWLKEAFASWGTPVALTQLEPEGGYDIDAVGSSIRAMRLDSLLNTRAVREPIEHNEDIRNAYDAITYSKGMAVIAMVDAYFGAEIFRPALGRYIEAYEDGVAASPDFFRIIGETTNEPRLTEVFQSFIEQQGVPELSVRTACEAGTAPTLTLGQSRYRPLGSEIDQSTRWTIPVCVAYGSEAGRGRTCTILSEAASDLVLDTGTCPAWVMPNAGGAGYYRWTVDDAGWQALVESFAALTPAEALSLVDSSIAAFEAGTGSAENVLAVLEAAAGSDSTQVATAPMAHLSRYARMLDGDALVQLQDYSSGLYAGRLAGLADAGTEAEQLLNSQITVFLSRTAQDKNVRSQLASDLTRYLDGDQAALSSDFYAAAMEVSIADQGVQAFDIIINAIETIDDPRFVAAAGSALGTAAAPELIERVQALALSGELGPRETYALIQSQMNRAATRETTWDWLKANYPTFVANIPRQWPRRTPGLAASFCDATRIAELDALFVSYGDLAPGHERALAQTRERLTLCSTMKARRMTGLAEAMQARN